MDLSFAVIDENASARRHLWWKRVLDLMVGGACLIMALPVIGLLALLVKLESPGPAFFRQERIGRFGAHFRIFKLRTMRVGCDETPHREAAAAWFAGRAVDERYKTLADPRITRVGRILRRLDLDELPQLFNVVRGEMSLVGPRPAIPYELAHYRPEYLERFLVPPGITGLWQVTQRECLSAPEMMQLDLRYVKEASLWLDLKILLMTVPALVAAALGRS
ncbi:MAG TPA: sugar transferase [Candidatus Dormibacteraeota bacterium]|jgi:lipopolysaccharide/colanic/teichoic acid biosynthesis glycosyltransferase|nr:sugar transferase [Candidatus Dormibacteraeota bacterium]